MKRNAQTAQKEVTKMDELLEIEKQAKDYYLAAKQAVEEHEKFLRAEIFKVNNEK